jgi:hypothetical protein
MGRRFGFFGMDAPFDWWLVSHGTCTDDAELGKQDGNRVPVLSRRMDGT